MKLKCSCIFHIRKFSMYNIISECSVQPRTYVPIWLLMSTIYLHVCPLYWRTSMRQVVWNVNTLYTYVCWRMFDVCIYKHLSMSAMTEDHFTYFIIIYTHFLLWGLICRKNKITDYNFILIVKIYLYLMSVYVYIKLSMWSVDNIYIHIC